MSSLTPTCSWRWQAPRRYVLASALWAGSQAAGPPAVLTGRLAGAAGRGGDGGGGGGPRPFVQWRTGSSPTACAWMTTSRYGGAWGRVARGGPALAGYWGHMACRARDGPCMPYLPQACLRSSTATRLGARRARFARATLAAPTTFLCALPCMCMGHDCLAAARLSARRRCRRKAARCTSLCRMVASTAAPAACEEAECDEGGGVPGTSWEKGWPPYVMHEASSLVAHSLG